MLLGEERQTNLRPVSSKERKANIPEILPCPGNLERAITAAEFFCLTVSNNITGGNNGQQYAGYGMTILVIAGNLCAAKNTNEKGEKISCGITFARLQLF